MAIFLLPMLLYTSPALSARSHCFLFSLFFFSFAATTCCCDSDTYFYFYVFYVHHPFHNIKIIGIGQRRNHKIYSFFFCLHQLFFFLSPLLLSSSTNEFLFCLITQKKKPAVEEGKKKVYLDFFFPPLFHSPVVLPTFVSNFQPLSIRCLLTPTVPPKQTVTGQHLTTMIKIL